MLSCTWLLQQTAAMLLYYRPT